MVVAFLFALGVLSIQFFGLGMTAFKVNHAAQEAAYVAGSGLEAASNRTPCWAVTGGLSDPGGYADAAVCRAVLENLGDVKPANVSVSVSPTLLERTKRTPVHVTIVYRETISSPLLRAFLGDTFTASADASSWSQ